MSDPLLPHPIGARHATRRPHLRYRRTPENILIITGGVVIALLGVLFAVAVAVS